MRKTIYCSLDVPEVAVDVLRKREYNMLDALLQKNQKNIKIVY